MTQLFAAEMRTIEQEYAEAIHRRQDRNGNPRAGLLILTRQMETPPEDQFEVDCMQLDFLAYKATEAVFQWRESPDWTEADPPQTLACMTADFREVIYSKPMYTNFRLPALIAFRTTLLKFTLLFTHRFLPSKAFINPAPGALADIQTRIEARSTFWKDRTLHSPAIRGAFDPTSDFPLPPDTLAQNRKALATSLGLHEPSDGDHSTTLPSLMVLLTAFMELTAARMALQEDWLVWEPRRDWRELAGQFMLQVILEEYLRHGAVGPEIFNTAFAFGCPGVAAEEDEPQDVEALRRVFCEVEEGVGGEQMHGWARTRRAWISHLLPKEGQSSAEAMEAAQASFPYHEFEERVLAFLRYMHDSVTKPKMVQVEVGEIFIDGVKLSEEETRLMIKRMELDRDD